jgi:hypothetical protein
MNEFNKIVGIFHTDVILVIDYNNYLFFCIAKL